MCLSAIIWANIKVVYYGNTKEDAEKIGFRDNRIYQYIQTMESKKEVSDLLQFIQIDREETLKVFEEYDQKMENKTMY